MVNVISHLGPEKTEHFVTLKAAKCDHGQCYQPLRAGKNPDELLHWKPLNVIMVNVISHLEPEKIEHFVTVEAV